MGGKPSRYFSNLEKRNYVNKSVNKIKNNSNQEITNQTEILEEIKQYYSDLYASRDDVLESADLNNMLCDFAILKLEDKMKEFLDRRLDFEEIGQTVKTMNNDKSPGPDGFPVDFYKFFGKDIGKLVFNSLSYAHCQSNSSYTQKQGIITFIPKGNKPREYIKNWRPISLLNTSYKIWSGCIARRAKSVLDSIIHENQTGFMSSRYIGENTRIL